MSAIHPWLDNLPTEHWVQLEQVVGRFETAWKQGQTPVIDDYLPRDNDQRHAILIELVHADLECRLQAGEPVRVEHYLERYPDLRSDAAAVASLAVCEYGIRSRRESGLVPGDLLRRFPGCRAELLRLQAEGPSSGGAYPTRPPAVTTQADGGRRPALPGVTAPPGYEVVRQLGQGGMGVVYLARQVDLDRLVALKMILAGSHAGRVARARFRTEAEAVARLQHPNVVQVFEVGEHDGKPYLALEYCRGGSLDRRLNGTPRPPAEAARLLETLARAVHAAHQAKVIHRDLKPANVLLTEDDTPKITDFGLARKTDEKGQSLSGDVMGTPPYMAPEQAGGKGQEVGPAADVYALGAILYELLTGRPPFQAATTAETLLRVISEEPVPPTRLQPKLPRDLETICLKCLQKERAKRYATADALADDLRRFANGEAILARPTPAWERAGKWARRKPAAAVSVLAGLVALLGLGLGGLSYALLADARARLAAQELADREAFDARQSQVRELIRQGQQAVAAGDWDEAARRLGRAQARAGAEPGLGPERELLGRLLDDVTDRLARQAARKRSRAAFEAFQRWRDAALVHDTGLTGPDAAANRKATREAAVRALAEFGLTDRARTAPRLIKDHFTDQEIKDINADCYELLLTLAAAVGQPSPARTDPRAAEEALDILEQARRLRGGPTNAYYLQRAACLARLGEADAARRARARADDPGLRAVTAADHFLLGKLLLGGEGGTAGDLARAVDHFRAAVRERPRHFWAHFYLAVAHLRSRPPQPQAAVECLAACATIQPDQVWVYVLRGFAFDQLNNFAAAAADFARAAGLARSDQERYILRVNRGAMLIHSGRLGRARADLEQAIGLKRGEFMAYVNLAQACQTENFLIVPAAVGLAAGLPGGRMAAAAAALRFRANLDEALRLVDEAVRLQPRLAALYSHRARLHLVRNQPRRALQDLETATRLPPFRGRAKAEDYTELGRILHAGNRFAEARTAYEAAVANDPSYPDAYRLLALLHMERKEVARAEAALTAYLKAGRPSARTYQARAMARIKLRKFPDAIGDCTRALELLPDSRSYALRGLALVQSGAPKSALPDFDAAIELDANNADAYSGRGFARVLTGQVSEAVADAEEVLKRDRDAKTAPYKAACIYAQAASRVANDPKLARRPREAEKRRQAYQAEALRLLRQALGTRPKGRERKDFWDEIERDTSLQPIRNTAGFAQLRQYAGKS